MDNFIVIYKILKSIEASMDFEEFDEAVISPEVLKVSEERRNKLLIEMQNDGYISGLNVKKYYRQPTMIMHPINLKITIKGLEYLSENSMMKKASNMLKGIVDIIT